MDGAQGKLNQRKSWGGLALLDTRCPPSRSITPLLSRTEREKIRWKKPFGSRGRLFNRAKGKAVCGPKRKRKIYYLLPIAGDVQSLPRTWGMLFQKTKFLIRSIPLPPLFLGFYMKFCPPGIQTRSTHYRSSSV